MNLGRVSAKTPKTQRYMLENGFKTVGSNSRKNGLWY